MRVESCVDSNNNILCDIEEGTLILSSVNYLSEIYLASGSGIDWAMISLLDVLTEHLVLVLERPSMHPTPPSAHCNPPYEPYELPIHLNSGCEYQEGSSCSSPPTIPASPSDKHRG